MTGNDFIFSKKGDVRMMRHLAFWLGCWLYMSLSYYYIQQSSLMPGFNPSYVSPGSYLVLKTFVLVLFYMGPCYVFINFMLPAIINRKWKKAILILLPVIFFMYGIGWIMYWKLFPFIDSLFGISSETQYPTQFWPAIVLGLIEPLKIIALATVIKYVKHWWYRQREKEILEQEKMYTELQLLKAQISPSFLFTSLDNIYNYALVSSPETPELLMKLSDLLSYMIYECDETFVPLQEEIERLRDFILLKKLSLNNSIEIGLNVKGDVSEKTVAPFLLLTFIESNFKECNGSLEQAWVNIDIDVTNKFITTKVAGSMEALDDSKKNMRFNDLTNVQKRLSLLYPQRHELKISWESEMFIALLKIRTTSEYDKSLEKSQLNPLA